MLHANGSGRHAVVQYRQGNIAMSIDRAILPLCGQFSPSISRGEPISKAVGDICLIDVLDARPVQPQDPRLTTYDLRPTEK